MTCKLNACTEKSTHSDNKPLIAIGSVIGLGLLYYLVVRKRK